MKSKHEILPKLIYARNSFHLISNALFPKVFLQTLSFAGGFSIVCSVVKLVPSVLVEDQLQKVLAYPFPWPRDCTPTLKSTTTPTLSVFA